MNWKQFLKPDWRKIVVTVLLIILLTISIKEIIPVLQCPIFENVDCPRFLPGDILGIMLIISLIISYFLSCLIVWIYDKYKKRK